MNFSDRSDYKKTWESLSRDSQSARHYVAGHDDADEFERSAQVTLSVLKDFVGVRKEDTFLEIGCGVGRVGKALSPHVARWIGTDISSGMIAQARNYLEGLSNVDLHVLEEPSLQSFSDDSIDVVYCTVVFMHLLEWDRYHYIKEAYRVLKPGGRAYFDNIDITTDHGWGMFEKGCRFPRDQRPAQISMISSYDELRTYGLKAGYSDVEVRRWGGAWLALTGRKPDKTQLSRGTDGNER